MLLLILSSGFRCREERKQCVRYGRERERVRERCVCVCELSEMNREGFINLLHKTKRKEETKK